MWIYHPLPASSFWSFVIKSNGLLTANLVILPNWLVGHYNMGSYGSLFTVMLLDVSKGVVIYLHFKNITYLFKYGTCFKGQAPPFSTISRLPPSPVGCAIVVLAPSIGLIMNLLVKTSQRGISKFITRSLFFRINQFSHIVISLLPVKFFNNLGTGWKCSIILDIVS